MSSSHDTRVNDMAAIRHNATSLNIDVLLFLLFSMFIVLRFLDGCFSVFSLSVADVYKRQVIGILLFVGVSLFNIIAVRRKVASIWMHKG